MAEGPRFNSRNIPRRDDRRSRPGGGRGGRDRRSGPGSGDGSRAGGSAIAAVPWYVGQNFNDTSPGHRYLLYLRFWRNDWSAIKEGKQKLLKDVGGLAEHVQMLMQALAARQRALGQATGGEVIPAVGISPFTTGLGWEHPNENGFAFLHPYGLPYFAGSGVKGVVRRAAEELALFGGDGSASDVEGWTMLDVWWLFGFEGASGDIWKADGDWANAYERHTATLLEQADLPEFLDRVGVERKMPTEERLESLKDKRRDLHLSGALRFFDVIPELAGNALGVDIMNPHYGDYYQGNSSPHDAGSPIPIFFLVVPPGSKFTFVVDCPRERYLPEGACGRWRSLIRLAFHHGFDWLGFGAKTAVGYGAMSLVSASEDKASIRTSSEVEPRAMQVTATAAVKSSAFDVKKEVWEKVTITWNAGGGGIITAVGPETGQKVEARGKAAEDFLNKLPEEQRKQLRERRKPLTDVSVVVEISGNQRTLKGLK